MSVWIPDARFEMPELLVPGGRPLRPVKVDASHPFSERLVACWMNDQLLTRNIALTGPGGDMQWNTNTAEPGSPVYIERSGKNSPYVYMTHDYAIPASGIAFNPVGSSDNVSILLIAASRTTDTNGNRGIFSRGTDYVVDYGSSIMVYFSGLSLHGEVIYTSGGAASYITSPAYTQPSASDAPYPIMLVLKQGVESALFVNGSRVASVSTPKTSLRSDNEGLQFSGKNTSGATGASFSNNGYAAVGMTAVWARAFSDVEAADITRNPYQFLIPQ